MNKTVVAIGLGANIGDRAGYLISTLIKLEDYGVIHQQISCVYESAPWGYKKQGPFLNLVVTATTNKNPRELLRAQQQIEIELGRSKSRRNGPREIDLDLLFFGQHVLHTETLTVPHPWLKEYHGMFDNQSVQPWKSQ